MSPSSSLIRHHLLLIFIFSCASLTSTSTTHNRRILHQPFYPHESLSPTHTPTPPPTPSPPATPDYPFTSSTAPINTPFFSTYPSPPSPPSPPSTVSFPANISSVILPQTHNSKPFPVKLIVTIATVVAAASILVFVAIVLHLRNRAFTDTKTNITHNNGEDNTRNGNIPKLQRPSQTSSEFLYLGTLVNSHSGLDAQHPHPPQKARNNVTNNGSDMNRGTMDSPELRPLPPLTGVRSYLNDEESSESASRRAFTANLNASRFSSSSYSSSSSGSGSPVRSVSLSISPPISSSPKSWTPKSPELIAVELSVPITQRPGEVSLSSTESSPRISDVESSGRISSSVRQGTAVSGPPVPPPLPREPIGIPRAPTPPFQKPPVQLPSHLENVEKNEEITKPKLKPLHWDKVRASPDHEMVWDQLRSSSFKVNEERIETLFVVNSTNSYPKGTTGWQVLPSPSEENGILNPKKSQNIAIFLKALHVTVDEVCEALLQGNADTIGTEILESLLRMAPTKEEERKLKEHKDDSPIKLGAAEIFLKAVINIPFAFNRIDAMLYTSNFDSEVSYLKTSFDTLEAACEELRNSRMFLKLLEAALKTGNRMNVGTNLGGAHAIKLDTLLKLVDVKGGDGKTTLLHFVVQEIIKSEGARVSSSNDDVKCRKVGLEMVSGVSLELINVKKAAAMDSQVLSSDVLKLLNGIEEIKEIVKLNEEATGCEEFCEAMNRFMKVGEEEIVKIKSRERVALSLVKEVTEYFHGNSGKKETETHPFRIFMVVRDFLMILDRVCKEVGTKNEQPIVITVNNRLPIPVSTPMLQTVSIGLLEQQQQTLSDN